MKVKAAALLVFCFVLFSVAAAEAQTTTTISEDNGPPPTVAPDEPPTTTADPDSEEFPPLPEVDGEPVPDGSSSTTVPDDENLVTTTSPTPPSSGLSPSNPFWFLPPDEGEFSYAESRERWEEICLSTPTNPEDPDNPDAAAEPSLPPSFIELYGDPDWSCGDVRRGSQNSDSAAFGDDEIGRICEASLCAGQVIPTSNYDIGADEGAWNHTARKTLIFFTSLLFTGNKNLMMVAFNLLEWAFGFEVAGAFSDEVSAVAVSYYGATRPVYDLALFLTMFVVGIHLMRGRTSAGLTELMTTMAVYSLFIFMALFSDAGYAKFMDDSIEWTGKTSGAMAEMTMDANTNSADCPPIGAVTPTGETVGMEGTVCPFGKGLHAAFVETPYDLINWGAPLDGACAAARDEILWQGPWGNSDKPRFIMGETPGCEQYADFNHDPTAERLGHAFIMFISSAIVLIIISLSALTMVAAQLMMAGLITVLPFAVVGGMIPGPGRTWLIKWAVSYVKAMFAVVALAMFLSLYLVALNVIIQITAGQAWIAQIGGIAVLTGLVFWVRQRLVKSSNAAVAQLGAKVSAKVSGNANNGSFSDAASSGFGNGRLRLRRQPGLYEARYAAHLATKGIRAVRDGPGNYTEMRTNQRERRAMRTLGHSPPVTPPRGFTPKARQRSKTRIARKERKRAIKALSGSSPKLRRSPESVGRNQRVQTTLANTGKKTVRRATRVQRTAGRVALKPAATATRVQRTGLKAAGRTAAKTPVGRNIKKVTPPFKSSRRKRP